MARGAEQADLRLFFPSLPGVSLRFEETSELKKLNNTENGRGLFSGKAVSLNLQGESQGKGWIKK